MDRYNDVKVLLKKWEQSFVQQQQRKPNKEDIDNAPEDTKNLYKEYRSLKQAKENSDCQSVPSGQHSATVVVNVNPKDSDCWGTHLNRSQMPVPSPCLTPEDRDNLQASAQYYGAKLKSNLGTLGKERPVSMRKSLTPGRTPLKSWKDRLTEQTSSPAASAAAAAAASPLRSARPALGGLGSPFRSPFGSPVTSPFAPRRIGNPFLGSPATKEPEEQFEALNPSSDTPHVESSGAGIASTVSVQGSSTANGISGGKSHSSGFEFQSPRLPHTPPPNRTMGTPGKTAGFLGRLNGSVESAGGVKSTVDAAESMADRLAVWDEDAGSPMAFGGDQRGGFRGGAVGVTGRGRPSLLSRLGSVDRGWLERCQVFGEVEGGDKPVAGNTEIPEPQRKPAAAESVGKGETRERPGITGAGAGEDGKDGDGTGNKMEKKAKNDEKAEIGDVGAGTRATEETVEASECASRNDAEATATAKSAGRRSGKVKGGRGKRKEPEGETDQSTEAESTTDQVGEEVAVQEKKASKRGRKRQREEEEGDEREGEEPEGAPTKRKRGPRKKKEEGGGGDGTDGGPTPVKKEGKRKKRVKKDEEEGEEEEEAEKSKKTKEPEKDPQENLMGEVDEGVRAYRAYKTQPASRVSKVTEGNFIKINLKKKSHVKGYALRGAGLRKQMYMEKFAKKGERFGGGSGRGSFRGGGRGGFRGGFNRQGDTCYKCGGTGHWAMNCKGPAPTTASKVSDDQPAVEEPFELPTLEEVARATGTLKCQSLDSPCATEDEELSKPGGPDGTQSDEVLLNVIRPDYERPVAPPPMEPLYSPGADGKVQATPDAVNEALRELGYQSFRPGQEDAIMRILSGLSTLVVLSTGMGKSLCYQLPAYLYSQRSKCLTLVISPLVSLMDDQLSGIPANLKAACIHSNMSMKQREAAIEKVKSGEVCVLLLSPEALVGGGGSSSGCLPPADQLPPVAFACIDEAHCVSEWSHNFRPCYLRLCKVLRERLGVRCLLGLTATATLSTAVDIAHHLDIHDKEGIAVRSAAVPENLQLSVSMDRDKDRALVSLLKGERFGCLDSIIVYCTRREETTRVSALLRTALQGVVVKDNPCYSSSAQAQSNPTAQKKKDLARKKIRKPLKWQAESYHAGLSASERRRVQNNFMCGELRLTVATVAFGMGLDKADVRGIVHYNMPKSFESYVQEIGRAGRDGLPAHCHLFLDPEGGDLHELRRHIYSDTVDYYTVKKLVQKVFPPCKCRQIHQKQLALVERKEAMEDNELLEMMDICEPESGLNTPTQPDLAQPVDPVPHGEVPSPSSAEMEPTPHDEQAEKEEQQQEVEEVNKPSGGDGPITDSDPTVPESTEEPEEKLNESGDWPVERLCHSHERAIPIQQTVESLDITEEGVETLLCYLELHPHRFVELLHPTLSGCKISCYDGPRQLQRITKFCPPVAVVLARKRMAGERVECCDGLEFDVVEVADTMGWQLSLVKRGLRQLQWSTEKSGGRSGIIVEFSSISFYFRSYGDLDDEEMDRVCEFLHRRVLSQEKTKLYQLSACFKAFQSVGYCNVSACVDALEAGRSLRLKALLSEYFDKKLDRARLQELQDDEELHPLKLCDWEDQIRADIRSFLSHRSDEKFSGRAVARILHGIASPCYPAQDYGRDRRYWRKYLKFDFNQLIRLATQEIIRFK
ncbi:ATP-dependent DNA helicase Q4 isoform X2 [Gadus macrocephalus]|uniref:ATP-dependent DNA helicase Q4 isoform X2 n=1 Tax=Gadus macrocephalus TaxID=80720 RepID=UPI0028CBBBAA|nr:ATP-dependent DNA helicase Q4 isoform X2 [Gadus macrocephalus]